MSLDKRLLSLERVAEDAEMPLAGVVLFRYGVLTDDQQQQIAQAEHEGRKVIIFNVVDASEDANV